MYLRCNQVSGVLQKLTCFLFATFCMSHKQMFPVVLFPFCIVLSALVHAWRMLSEGVGTDRKCVFYLLSPNIASIPHLRILQESAATSLSSLGALYLPSDVYMKVWERIWESLCDAIWCNCLLSERSGMRACSHKDIWQFWPVGVGFCVCQWENKLLFLKLV